MKTIERLCAAVSDLKKVFSDSARQAALEARQAKALKQHDFSSGPLPTNVFDKITEKTAPKVLEQLDSLQADVSAQMTSFTEKLEAEEMKLDQNFSVGQDELVTGMVQENERLLSRFTNIRDVKQRIKAKFKAQ